MRRIRAVCVLLILFVATPLPGLAQMLAIRLNSRASSWMPHIYHRCLCRLLDIRIECIGSPVEQGPCLIAANHASWIDISVLSALFPARFIAKSEVNTWPIVGWLARLQQTLFVERDRRSSTGKFKEAMKERFEAQQYLVLFPEGTSTDGNRVLPFKSALFGAIEMSPKADGENLPVTVQPVSIVYTKFHGLPMGRNVRPLFTWYGDMEIAPHIWQALCAGPCDVRVEFHEPVTAQQFENRKALAQYSEDCVRNGLLVGLTGRDIK